MLADSAARFLATAQALTDDDLYQASALPGWTRAHVLTHLAQAADSRTGLLRAARAGRVGRQYPSEQAVPRPSTRARAARWRLSALTCSAPSAGPRCCRQPAAGTGIPPRRPGRWLPARQLARRFRRHRATPRDRLDEPPRRRTADDPCRPLRAAHQHQPASRHHRPSGGSGWRRPAARTSKCSRRPSAVSSLNRG
jgi:hypothetical protein